ncbi:cellulose synthase (UDP-forming) [Catenuloplanes nepalensis]|uniref:Cellulose synthase (UDP-forming) n=1 Tax=Catenuloplanes nepalensis TaxID=587533 RepID=A0ABT9MR83_9ACTN|nr:glycosyltransferase [Catenuloplanes nepalensis]MDP9793934.1 cellulose synthase (UDP-forming) [Catenuloplanes nepalensis]
MIVHRDPRWFPALFWTFLVLATAFVVWRTAVVDWTVWYGPVAWSIELFGVLTSICFMLTLRRAASAAPRTVDEIVATVDILIPTANEPPLVLEPTVIGAMRVRGVRDVLVLDDGDRAEVREMAARHGARYVARTTNEGAKAGNLNNGLRFTDAEFVITLDADHIPLPEFAERTIGYFDDPRVGFVQSPQSFYNQESFTFRGDRGWHEQGMFYGGIQPTKNYTNSAIYTGTSAMLRRAAIDSAGGFAPDTPTEDIHTSLRIHARGWKSIYLGEPLAYGLEVENLREYYRTRRRWAAGSLRLLFRHPDSPLRVRGLTGWQRLNYFSAMVTHLQGPIRVLYLLAPLAALITGVAPVTGPYSRYGFAFLAFTVVSVWIVVIFGRGHYHLLHSEAFGVADTVPMISALRALAGNDRTFGVTVKRTDRTSSNSLKNTYRLYALASLAVLTLAAARLIQGEHVAIAAWAGAFLALSTGYALTFLISMERYERAPGAPWYATLTPAELYDAVVARGASARLVTA